MARSSSNKDQENLKLIVDQQEALAESTRLEQEAVESKPPDKPQRIVKQELQFLMSVARIPGVSIASIDSEGKISATVVGVTEKDAKRQEIKPETEFGAASLSKPVFAYLVLKLIRDNKADEAKSGLGKFERFPAMPWDEKIKNQFDLDTPLYKVFPGILYKFVSAEDMEKAKKLTARMILTHTTGLPIVHDIHNLSFQFEPGTQYGYSGPGIALLQEAIEALTDCDLEKLAIEHIFKEGAIGMPHTSFQRDASTLPQAANSLSTTPSDYAKFMRAWMMDPTLNDAFKPGAPGLSMKKAFLPKDWPIKDAGIPDADREHVSWGLGIGLQLDDKGHAISAYHSGDMGEWRAWVAMNLEEKSAIVYCSNSHNGHAIAEKIIPSEIKLDHALNVFFRTYGFARNLEELAKEAGVEFNNGLRKGCLSSNRIEEKKSGIEEKSSTAKITDDLSHMLLQPELAVNPQSSDPLAPSTESPTKTVTVVDISPTLPPAPNLDDQKPRKKKLF